MESAIKLDLTKTPAQIFSRNLVAIAQLQQVINDLNKLKQEDIRKVPIKKIFILNSYLVLLNATWEAFIENTIKFHAEKIINDKNKLKKILLLLSNKEVTTKVTYEDFIKDKIDCFHSPEIKKINTLFHKTL